MDVIYFGYSSVMLKKLLNHGKYDLQGVVTEKGKVGKDFLDICKLHDIAFIEVENKRDLLKNLDFIKTQIIVMYEFGIIIPQELCNQKIIINFHPGKLENNRGANPISWSILYKELGAEMCAYIISEKIDVGEIISENEVTVYLEDDVNALKVRLESCIEGLLDDIYRKLDSGHYRIVYDGVYRQRIREEDYTINLEEDSLETVIRKVNSQIGYKGAIIFWEGKKYHVNSLEICIGKGDSFKSLSKDFQIEKYYNKSKVIFCCSKENNK